MNREQGFESQVCEMKGEIGLNCKEEEEANAEKGGSKCKEILDMVRQVRWASGRRGMCVWVDR